MSEDSSLHLITPEKAVMVSLSSALLEHDTPSISVNIERVARCLILDTGPKVSIMQPGISGSAVEVTHIRPYGVTGKGLNIKGQQTVSFVVDGREFSHTFLLCSLPTDAAGLLGTDFLNKAGVSIDFGCGKMSLADIGKAPQTCKAPPTKCTALVSLHRVKRDTALNPVYGRPGIKTSSSQPAPTERRLLPRMKLGSLRLKKI